jgi:DNA-binding CsgD family transcriptional regulator
MTAKKHLSRRPLRSVDKSPPDWRCPICGALQSEGECKDSAECARILATAKAEYAREIGHFLEQAKSSSVPLLMAGFEALDLLNIGLAVTSATGLLLMANGAAEQILLSRDGLELSDEGMFGVMKGCGRSLAPMLQRAAQFSSTTAANKSENAVVAVHRPSGKRAYTLLVRSVRPLRQEQDAGALSCALVFILDPQVPVEAAESELRQLFDVTSTEARLANLLMEGRTLDECCELLKIRRSTGRTHLQHLFEKVGVQRQSELVSVLLKSIGLLRTQPTEATPGSINGSERLRQSLLKTLLGHAVKASNLS